MSDLHKSSTASGYRTPELRGHWDNLTVDMSDGFIYAYYRCNGHFDIEAVGAFRIQEVGQGIEMSWEFDDDGKLFNVVTVSQPLKDGTITQSIYTADYLYIVQNLNEEYLRLRPSLPIRDRKHAVVSAGSGTLSGGEG